MGQCLLLLSLFLLLLSLCHSPNLSLRTSLILIPTTLRLTLNLLTLSSLTLNLITHSHNPTRSHIILILTTQPSSLGTTQHNSHNTQHTLSSQHLMEHFHLHLHRLLHRHSHQHQQSLLWLIPPVNYAIPCLEINYVHF